MQYQPGDIVQMKKNNRLLIAGPCIIFNYNRIGQPYLLSSRGAHYGWDSLIEKKIGHEADLQAIRAGIKSGKIDIGQIIKDAGVTVDRG